jgi:hypothetical protein
MTLDDEPIYLGRVHPKDQAIINEITTPRNWNYERFRRVVISLATVRQYVPAYNRPDSIHFQGLRSSIDKLRKMAENEKEHAQVVFADVGRETLILGKISSGTKRSVKLDLTPQPGRKSFQRRALTIHVHPEEMRSDIGHNFGLSDDDFVALLSDREQIGMFMVFGKNIFIALKTTATPNNLKKDSVKRRIEMAKNDYLEAGRNTTSFESTANFNKAVCSEFGLTLYLATPQTGNLANRVEVTI